ncbi:glycosyltransferase [Patescibacteria group bacterium]|nr:MAG: glycosyltransferase [Patescibacteria group bacterium]
MHLLMLSSDVKIFDAGSRVANRMALYGSIVDELLIVVAGVGVPQEITLAPNVRAVTAGGTNRFSSFLNMQRTLRALTKEKAYDIVSAQDPFFIGVLGYGIAKARHIPFQVQLHTDCFSLGFLTESPRRVIEALLAIFILGRATCIRVVSERVLKSVRKVTKVPVTVLPIHTEYTSDVGPTRSNIGSLKFLSVSRLTSEKRVHLIIDAVALTPDAELTIVGDGPLKKSLEFRVKRLGLGERVRFVGWQDPAQYYESADVFVQASRFEGYGVSLIEAGLSGLAIITTDVGIVGEVFEDKKEALVVSGTSSAIAVAMKRLIEDKEIRMRLGAQALESARHHSMSMEEYLLCYQRALSRCSI